MSAIETKSYSPPKAPPEWLALVRQQVESLRYGNVEIAMHGARVIQIEQVERVRLDKPVSETNKPTKTKL